MQIFVNCTLLRHINAMQRAMEYVFGSTFVCKTIDAAREVCLFKRLLDAIQSYHLTLAILVGVFVGVFLFLHE